MTVDRDDVSVSILAEFVVTALNTDNHPSRLFELLQHVLAAHDSTLAYMRMIVNAFKRMFAEVAR